MEGVSEKVRDVFTLWIVENHIMGEGKVYRRLISIFGRCLVEF